MKFLSLFLLLVFFPFQNAHSFCGFYVAKADTKLFNKASKVVLTRKDNRTIITMANDFQGDLTEFAIVIPVPTVLEREQIHVANNALVDHLDAYTAPRLVEYFDPNPCRVMYDVGFDFLASIESMPAQKSGKRRDKALGVTIEAEYTVGEYDILILSATESDGLQTWLQENGYKMPEGAAKILHSYIKQGTKFFIARVNLEEQAKLGHTYLRPLQIAFESPKFMLPIRLGTLNANGSQELFIFTLTPKGRVETTNYRTVKIPSNIDIPIFVKGQFGKFYASMFDTVVEKEDMRAVFLEYAWDMSWCDPCAADPLSNDELRALGVFWIEDTLQKPGGRRKMLVPQQAQKVFVSRLHLRYDAAHFPEDLVFQETADTSNFQGRYILNHPWEGEEQCNLATTYRASLPERFNKEAQNLASLTSWDITTIRDQMNIKDTVLPKSDDKKWWKKLWPEK